MNKRMYNQIVPNYKPSWSIKKSDFILVKEKTKFYAVTWSKNTTSLESTKLFEIKTTDSK